MACTTRSCLELMLEKIQQLEKKDDDDQPKDIIPPALPVRPVSRARLPPASCQLKLHDFQKRNCISEANFTSKRIKKQDESATALPCSINGFHHHFREAPSIEILESSKEIASSIQKWYRGHRGRCYYKDLRRGAIALQSFVRGENARRGYGHRIKRLRAIILIQKQTRNYLEYRQVKKQQHVTGNCWHSDQTIHEPNKRDNTDTNCKETMIWAGYGAVIDLQKRVLRIEAKARGKKEENIALTMRLEEMDKKWQQYEERIKSMEKAWQDEFTHIQKCLTSGKKMNDPDDAKTISRTNPNGRSFSLDFSINEMLVYDDHDEDINRYKYSHKILNPHEELSKLKLRFKAWKKDYRSKLRKTHWMFKKLGIHSEKVAVKTKNTGAEDCQTDQLPTHFLLHYFRMSDCKQMII